MVANLPTDETRPTPHESTETGCSGTIRDDDAADVREHGNTEGSPSRRPRQIPTQGSSFTLPIRPGEIHPRNGGEASQSSPSTETQVIVNPAASNPAGSRRNETSPPPQVNGHDGVSDRAVTHLANQAREIVSELGVLREAEQNIDAQLHHRFRGYLTASDLMIQHGELVERFGLQRVPLASGAPPRPFAVNGLGDNHPRQTLGRPQTPPSLPPRANGVGEQHLRRHLPDPRTPPDRIVPHRAELHHTHRVSTFDGRNPPPAPVLHRADLHRSHRVNTMDGRIPPSPPDMVGPVGDDRPFEAPLEDERTHILRAWDQIRQAADGPRTESDRAPAADNGDDESGPMRPPVNPRAEPNPQIMVNGESPRASWEQVPGAYPVLSGSISFACIHSGEVRGSVRTCVCW